MKYLAVLLSVSVALPVAAHAEEQEINVAETAQMLCDQMQICGQEAVDIVMRDVVIANGVAVRRPRVLGAGSVRQTPDRPAGSATTTTPPRQPASPTPAFDSSDLAAQIIPPEVAGTSDLMVTFASNSSMLTETSQTSINSFAAGLMIVDELRESNSRFRIEGHTDAVGSDTFNQQLSEQRAQAVVDALVELGIPAERFEVVGKGESEPLDGRRGTDPLNRRVVAVAID